MYRNDTIAAIATALSESGIGIVRISGEKAISIADSVFCTKAGRHILNEVESHTIHYGYITEDNELVDEVMVSVMKGPRSYTAEDVVEISCHGGIMIVKKVFEIIINAGARIADPGEFTKRAYLNGRIDLTKAEAVMDLIHSNNEYALKSSFRQLRGNLSAKITGLREKLIYEIAYIESALDDPEHISLDGYDERIREILEKVMEELEYLIASSENGRIVKEGIQTVIIGKPNAGKSSLLNMILGQERAIVTDVAGTTRDVLEESVQIKGIHLNIMDTAGIRDAKDMVEKIGVERAKKYAEEADLIFYVVDTSDVLDDSDREILEIIRNKKILFLLNKSDLETKTSKEDLFDLIGKSNMANDNCHFVFTSAKAGDGLDQIFHEIEDMFLTGKIKENSEILITNVRHKEALTNALNSLKLVMKSVMNGMPEDFYSIDLMDAYTYLGSIIGEEVGDDLVEEIFSKFCMGK